MSLLGAVSECSQNSRPCKAEQFIPETYLYIYISGKKFPLQKGCTCESYKTAKQACFIVKHVVGNSIL